MKNNIIAIILLTCIILAGSIISIFAFICDVNKNLEYAIISSSIVSIVIFIIVFFLGKKILFQEKLQQQELEETKEKLDVNQYIDPLTKLPNRMKFFEDLPQAQGIILLDLDDFSILNSVYSKEFGDEYLIKLANKLKASSCATDLYRLGGDEFAVLAKEMKDLKGTAECLAKVIDKFYIVKDNIMIQTSATLAVTYKQPFIETADLILKYAKKHKMNIIVYSDSLDVFENSQTFLDITMRIKKALKTNNVVPFFQCIVDKNEKIVKYEALMRIKEGEKYILPAVFLDVAKKTKLYPELTIQMITKTFVYMRDKNIPFSFNLSYDDIINKRIYNFILEEIDRFPMKENIIVELLETENMKSLDYVRKFISEVHKRGAKVAIDDFGSGYSNFVYLEKLQADIIKIDGDIVSNILSSDNALFVVKTIVEFCQQNNLTSVAEFVSHREIFLTLQELGVDEYQGFYFCTPKESIK